MNVSGALTGVIMPSGGRNGMLSTKEDREMHLSLLQQYILIKETLWNCSQNGDIDLQLFYCSLREMASPAYMRVDASGRSYDRSAGMRTELGDDNVCLEKFALINMNRNRRMVEPEESTERGDCPCREQIEETNNILRAMQRQITNIENRMLDQSNK